jgi:hypothetical protein
MDDFIDVHNREKYLGNKRMHIIEDQDLSVFNKKAILGFLRAAELGKHSRHGKPICGGRALQCAGFMYRMARDWFQCDLDKVTDRQMETFILDLNKGIILNKNGTAYTSEAKSNIKKFIRTFYKWLLGNGKVYPELVDWIDTAKKDAEIEAIPGLEKGM